MRSSGLVRPGISALALVLPALLGLLGAGCSDKSFAVVTVRAAEGEFTNVTQFLVDVRNGTNTDTLRYPRTPTAAARFNTTEGVDFSVSFKTSYKGTLKVGVTPLGPGGVPLGYGEGEQVIDPGETIRLEVRIVRGALPPPPPGDGGAGDAADALADGGLVADAADGGGGDATTDSVVVDAGADAQVDMVPAPIACEPTNPRMTCGATDTCFVSCQGATGMGQCTPGGTKRTGEACATNADCEPGTQCFEFPCGAAGAAGPRVCLRFCSDDTACGTGKCFTSVPCGGMATGHKVCSQPCDPRGTATNGCAAGLTCFIFPGEVPSCDCRGATRVGNDGDACTDTTNCAPGLLCVGMGGAKVCRPICRLGEMDCAGGRTCTKLVDPEYLTWGACVP